MSQANAKQSSCSCLVLPLEFTAALPPSQQGQVLTKWKPSAEQASGPDAAVSQGSGQRAQPWCTPGL